MKETKDNEIRETPTTETEWPRLFVRIGRSDFLLGFHFAEQGKETIEDKVKRLILKDLKDGNF